MRGIWGLAPVAMLAAATLACTLLPGGTVLFKDDFSDASGGWKYTGYSTYADGELRLRLSDADTLVQTLINQPSLSNIHVEVTGRNTAAAGDEAFGVACDFRSDRNDQTDGYVLGLGTDGYYFIGKFTAGQMTTLKDGQSNRFTDAAATYRLAADCGGGQLALSVNGRPVAAAADTAYTYGDAGLFLASGKKLPAEAGFNDFVVSTLK
jgi:hypothetical protein